MEPGDRLQAVSADIIACRTCPRLVAWRERVATERAQGLERLIATYDELENVVEELLAQSGEDAKLAPLVKRLAQVKSQRPAR